MSRPRTETHWAIRNLISIAVALAMAALFLVLHSAELYYKIDFTDVIEGKTVDLRFRLRGEIEPSGEVIIAAIDSASVEEFGRWPWNRTIHARFIDRMIELRAKTIAWDVLFTEPQSPQEIDRLRRLSSKLDALQVPESPPGDGPDLFAELRSEFDQAVTEVDADAALAAAIDRTYDADAAWVVLAYDFIFPQDLGDRRELHTIIDPEEETLLLDAATYFGRDENTYAQRHEPPELALGVRPVIAPLAGAATLGFANYVQDNDSIMRRERMAVVYSPMVQDAFNAGESLLDAIKSDDSWVQTFMPLAVAAVATHWRLETQQMLIDLPTGTLSLDDEQGRSLETKFDRFDGTMRIPYYGPDKTIPTYSIVDIFSGELKDADGHPIDPAEAFEGKLVFIGMSDPGLADFFPTPFTARLPGVEKHATVADAMLSGRSVATHLDPDKIILITSFLLALLTAIVAGNLSAVSSGLIVTASTLTYLIVTFEDFATDGLIWPWTIPILTVVFAYTGVTGYRQLAEAKAKRAMLKRSQFVQDTFGRYLNDKVVKMLVDDPEGLTLGGEKMTLTILMSDLRGFTALCERCEPDVVIGMLNHYLGTMADLVLEYDGMIDEFIGDAVLALFGAPREKEDDAQRAIACAIQMQRGMEQVNARLKEQGLPEVEMGIALNTGEVIVGNIGSEKRSKYGVVGSNVNLTARIESYTVGGQVLISGATYEEAGDIVEVGERIEIKAKGLKDPVPAYDLKAIGGSFNVRMPEIIEVMLDNPEPIFFKYGVLEGKAVDELNLEGKLVRISKLGGDLEVSEALPARTNIKAEVLDREGKVLATDLYAKVFDRGDDVADGAMGLRFTAVPPEFKKLLKGLLKQAKK